jgi:hypothetical protein
MSYCKISQINHKET